MIELLFVVDGPRDHATVPHLVEKILGSPLRGAHVSWARLHSRGAGSGYRKKLQFAVRQANDARKKGVVATVDTDKDPHRRKLRDLQDARASDRLKYPIFPTVLGEADPHGEAWLLDDPVAVRRALGIADGDIPNVRKTSSPKDELGKLLSRSSRAEDDLLEVLSDIAKLVEPSRCQHTKETGFRNLQEEVRQELLPLLNPTSG